MRPDARGGTYNRLTSAPDYNPSVRRLCRCSPADVIQLTSAPAYNPSMRAVVPTNVQLTSAPAYNPSMRAVVPTNVQLTSAPAYNPSMRAVVPTNVQLTSAPAYNPSMRAVVPTIVRPFCRSEGVGFRVAFIGPSQRHAFRDILACYVFPPVVSPPSTPKPPACTT
ncbi:hypothetical protein B0H15DRAFT_951204 [Mycena belliarum]|uniref:Uncharacterized protein n=1 Tax=Mycena belliarum TaxID=1033014 RepID=A0AAD6TZQ0_9AGAR|nr:hypothetical protein B0H15DRAFT_951204 [Mycena belliae]